MGAIQRTAMLGTIGVLQPGYACGGSATWQGPFAAQVQFPGSNGFVIAHLGDTFAVGPVGASQLAAGDQPWWELH